MEPLPSYIAPYDLVGSNPELASLHSPIMIFPLARNFLNSKFVNVQSLHSAEDIPHLSISLSDALNRNKKSNVFVQIYNQRGWLIAKARVTDKARSDQIVRLFIRRKKLSRDGKNANEVTSQRLTDMGSASTFYDVWVQVEKRAIGI